MEQYINKSALVAEIESIKNRAQILGDNAINSSMQQFYDGMKQGCVEILSFLDTLEVKEVDIDKMLYFRRNIGFAYPEGASEYQKHLACYRQGIEDVLKAQKEE